MNTSEKERVPAFAKRLGAELRAIREAMHWPQTELANRLGVTREAISFMERGHLKSIDFETLALLQPLMASCWCCGKKQDSLLVLAARTAAQRTGRKGAKPS